MSLVERARNSEITVDKNRNNTAASKTMFSLGERSRYNNLTVGSHVVLAPDFRKEGDAKGGPLKVGDIGIVEELDSSTEDDGSSKPYRVKYDGESWSYTRDALLLVDATGAL